MLKKPKQTNKNQFINTKLIKVCLFKDSPSYSSVNVGKNSQLPTDS